MFKQSSSIILFIFININSVLSKFCTFSSKEKYTGGDPISTFMSNQPLAYWMTDRESTLESANNNLNKFIKGCNEEEPIVVVYGLPGKDCDAGESSSGFNRNEMDYNNFLQATKKSIGSISSTIILEPDALALTVDGSKCGLSKGYKNNLKKSIEILNNDNYKLYLDVGHWIVIYGDDKIKQMLQAVSEIDPGNKLKGFSLGLSNYRKTDELVNACRNIRKISGKDYKCIIDTSRNNNGPSNKGTWCNYKNAGIGVSGNDVSASKDSSIDAYLWIKPAVELDGNCYGNDESYQSGKGAGAYDYEWLNILWNNGYYKEKLLSTISMPNINPNANWNNNPTGNPTGSPNANWNNNPTGNPHNNLKSNIYMQKKIKICKA